MNATVKVRGPGDAQFDRSAELVPPQLRLMPLQPDRKSGNAQPALQRDVHPLDGPERMNQFLAARLCQNGLPLRGFDLALVVLVPDASTLRHLDDFAPVQEF